RFLLHSVVRPAKGGASTRLAIGVVENLGGAQPGIPLASMRARVGVERHRSIILISAILSRLELTATSLLIGDLDKAKRRWQRGGLAPNCEPRRATRPRASCHSFSVACRCPSARAMVLKSYLAKRSAMSV